jgi:Flp pilus assembly protein TadD
LLAAFARYVTLSSFTPSKNLIERALKAATRAVSITKASDPKALAVLAKTLLMSGRAVEAGWFIDQALILSPLDPGLRELREQIGSSSCE